MKIFLYYDCSNAPGFNKSSNSHKQGIRASPKQKKQRTRTAPTHNCKEPGQHQLTKAGNQDSKQWQNKRNILFSKIKHKIIQLYKLYYGPKPEEDNNNNKCT